MIPATATYFQFSRTSVTAVCPFEAPTVGPRVVGCGRRKGRQQVGGRGRELFCSRGRGGMRRGLSTGCDALCD